jgi:hypothetical protein
MLLTLLAWLLCAAVFMPVAIIVGLMAFGPTVGVSLAVLLLSFLAGLLFFLPAILLAVLFDVAC